VAEPLSAGAVVEWSSSILTETLSRKCQAGRIAVSFGLERRNRAPSASRNIARMIGDIQPTTVAIEESAAKTKRRVRKGFNGMTSLRKRSATSMIAGTEMMAIGFHAMVEPGNRKGREARMMAANRAVASEMYAISLFIFMPSSIWGRLFFDFRRPG